MALQDDFREAIICLDVKRAMAIWAVAAPGLPAPRNAAEAEVQLHAARLEMKTLPPRLKAYSKRWLEERAMLPKKAFGVGIAVKPLSVHTEELARMMQMKMAQAVLDAVKDGVSIEHEPEEISRRMEKARLTA